jgi:hypothetical protein
MFIARLVIALITSKTECTLTVKERHSSQPKYTMQSTPIKIHAKPLKNLSRTPFSLKRPQDKQNRPFSLHLTASGRTASKRLIYPDSLCKTMKKKLNISNQQLSSKRHRKTKTPLSYRLIKKIIDVTHIETAKSYICEKTT